MRVNALKALIFRRNVVALIRLATLTIVLTLCFIIYAQWSAFVAITIEWQKELHSMLASHINSISEDVLKYGGALIALSFGYGVLHAIGPGHGKAVVVSYLGTNKESLKKGILISFSAAILQALIAIILVSALARILKFKLADVHSYGNDMALVSYVLVIVLGAMLLLGSLKRLFKSRSLRLGTNHLHHNHGASLAHEHDSTCGCSHSHTPEPNESLWQTLMVILSMGLRPCSGAIVVLIYAHLVGVYVYGVIATLMMGVGTGLSVSLIAVLALSARSYRF